MDIIKEMDALYKRASVMITEKETDYHDIKDFEEGRTDIQSLRQAEGLLRSELLAAREKQYYISKIAILPKKRYRLGVTSRSYSRLNNFIPVGEGAAKKSANGLLRKFDRYSDALLQIKIEDLPTEYKIGFVENLHTFKILKVEDKFYMDRSGNGMNVVDIERPNVAKPLNVWGFLKEDGALRDDIIVYGHLDGKSSESYPTAGEIKKFTMTMVAVKHPNPDVDAEVIQYALTYGASRAFCDEKAGQSTRKNVAQNSTRGSQCSAGNTPVGFVNCFAVLMGKLKDVNGNEYRDGWGFVSATLVSMLLTMLTGGKFNVLATAVIGLLLQCRPYLCKLMAECVSDEYLRYFIERLGLEIVVLFRDKLTKEDQEQFNLGMKTKGKEGKFAGKIVVICDNEECWHKWGIQFFTDVNGLKAPFDLRFRSTLNVLDVSHGEKDVETGASFSTQLVQSLMIADWKRTVALTKDLFVKATEDARTRIMSEEGKAPRIKDLEHPRWNMILADILPALPQKFYFPLYRQIVKESMKGFVGLVNNLKVSTEGFYAKVISDPGMDFGLDVLKILSNGKMEVFAPIATRHKYTHGIAVKFPKQHYQEFGALEFVDYEEYSKRVRDLMHEGKITPKGAELLCDKILRTSEGAIVMPAYERVKNMLAGMDYDGDAVIVYLNKEIVSIMENLKPLAVVIEPDDDKTKGFTVDKNVGFTAMANAIMNDNLDVGAVTVLHSVFSIILCRAKHKTGKVAGILNTIFGLNLKEEEANV